MNQETQKRGPGQLPRPTPSNVNNAVPAMYLLTVDLPAVDAVLTGERGQGAGVHIL